MKYNIETSNSFGLMESALLGVPVSAFFDLLEITGLSQAELASILDVSSKTMMRYKKENKKLNALNSEQVLKIISLYKKGVSVFSSLDSFNRWLRKPSHGLGGQVPLGFLQTSGGIDLVAEEVARIEFGALA